MTTTFAAQVAGAGDEKAAQQVAVVDTYRRHSFWFRQAYAGLIGTASQPAENTAAIVQEYVTGLVRGGETALPGGLAHIQNPSPALRAVHDALLDSVLSITQYADAAHPTGVEGSVAPLAIGHTTAYANLKRAGVTLQYRLENEVTPNLEALRAEGQLSEGQFEALDRLIHRGQLIAQGLKQQAALDQQGFTLQP